MPGRPQNDYTVRMASQAGSVRRVTIEPDTCGGQPCIRGMRIRVVDIFEMLAAGESPAQILEDFPDLEADDIVACYQYALERLTAPQRAV